MSLSKNRIRERRATCVYINLPKSWEKTHVDNPIQTGVNIPDPQTPRTSIIPTMLAEGQPPLERPTVCSHRDAGGGGGGMAGLLHAHVYSFFADLHNVFFLIRRHQVHITIEALIV